MSDGEEPEGAPLACLVVEDNPMMRELLVHALHRVGGLEVTQAVDGVDALRKLAAGPYGLILTDINMPMLDGLKLVQRIRSDAAHREVPLVVVTTESSEGDRQRAMNLGATAYVTKPIQAQSVIATVKRLLGRS